MALKAELVHRYLGHAAGLYALCLHRHGKSFFSGGSDKILTSWNLEDNSNEAFQSAFPNIIYSAALLPSEKELVCGTFSGDLHVINLEEKKESRIFRLHTSGVFDLNMTKGAPFLVSASGDGTICFFDPLSLSLVKQIKICAEKVRSISFDPKTRRYAIAAGDGTLRIFDADSLNEIRVIKAHELSANTVSWDPSGKWLISGGRDAMLRIWNADTFTPEKEIAAHNFALYGLAFHPEGHLMATASRDRTIRIWETATFRPLLTLDQATFNGHRNSVNRLVWSSFENALISCSDDRTIIRWSIELE